MIYGDQSQEGFLLRDYFCCDTNELRLQTHCRPITPEKRLRAYYAQIIRRLFFFSPSSAPRLESLPRVQMYILLCTGCVAHGNVGGRARLLSATPPPPPLLLSALLIYRCCIVLPGSFTQLYLSVHQYATYACVRLRPGSPA